MCFTLHECYYQPISILGSYLSTAPPPTGGGKIHTVYLMMIKLFIEFSVHFLGTIVRTLDYSPYTVHFNIQTSDFNLPNLSIRNILKRYPLESVV
jgi:hypothetical protein